VTVTDRKGGGLVGSEKGKVKGGRPRAKQGERGKEEGR